MTWQDDVRDALGRELDQSSYERLDELPAQVIDDVRAVWKRRRLSAIGYLHHLVPSDGLGLGTEFLDDVVIGGADLSTWRRGNVLCRHRPQTTVALTMTTAELLAPLSGLQGERWFRSRSSPSFDHHRVPGVLIRGQTYRWRSPEGLSCTGPSPTEYEPVDDLELAVTRWMAAAVAGTLCRMSPAVYAHDTLDQLAARLPVPVEKLSPDGRLALDGLLRELRELGPPGEKESAGFRGEDGWYRR